MNYLLTFFVALSLLFGVLSYHFYGAKAEAESALVQVIDANTELQKSLNLRDLSCKIDNKVASEYQAEKQAQQDKMQVTVSKIDALPSNPIPKKASVQSQVKQDAEIDIDSPLPDSLVKLLRESCGKGEGDACISPR